MSVCCIETKKVAYTKNVELLASTRRFTRRGDVRVKLGVLAAHCCAAAVRGATVGTGAACSTCGDSAWGAGTRCRGGAAALRGEQLVARARAASSGA